MKGSSLFVVGSEPTTRKYTDHRLNIRRFCQKRESNSYLGECPGWTIRTMDGVWERWRTFAKCACEPNRRLLAERLDHFFQNSKANFHAQRNWDADATPSFGIFWFTTRPGKSGVFNTCFFGGGVLRKLTLFFFPRENVQLV